VLVLDTTGELKCYFKSAAAVFVGGSLDSVGGHNLFEPAMFARPLAAGPQLDGVREQADALLAGGGLCVVADAAGLAQHWLGLLDDPAAAQSQGGKAREAVLRVSGALARTLKVIEPLLAEPADGRARGLETGTRRDA
jgi:3-deoxy-D-manno-octulosonic-acid transferase